MTFRPFLIVCYVCTMLLLSTVLSMLGAVDRPLKHSNDTRSWDEFVGSPASGKPIQVYIHKTVWNVLSFTPVRYVVPRDVPLVIWKSSTTALRLRDTFQYSYDLHDAGQCIVDSISYNNSTIVGMQLSDGDRRFSVFVDTDQSAAQTEHLRLRTYVAVQNDSNVVSVESALANILAGTLKRDASPHSIVRVREDTIEVYDHKRRCIGFRVWIDMLRTHRVGGIVTEDVATSRRVIRRGEAVFLIKKGGKFRLMESKGRHDSEEPSDFQIGAEIMSF